MALLISSASTSLDGFVASPDDDPGPLFDWYSAGDVVVPNAGDLPPFHLTPTSAAHWRDWVTRLGCVLVGRRLFDLTDGWRGRHPLGVPVVVLTHRPPTGWDHPGTEDPTFATTVPEAVAAATAIAGERVVGVAAGEVATQLHAAGLLDEVRVDLVPVFLGRGRRYFTDPDAPVRLSGPSSVVVSEGVTHLSFPVRR
ncbi:dihydrofolate reductase family protein [Kineococcus aurantiacus]|uniref:Dihydrofolate reductase n=1 Tax=Kineococcus aurantiacus TaxID=37633 RepID=A0A7Y9DMM4_9ACTN|nr:dihydrofolate reductase family protein [Kineococcus aurantiacus]NYD23412.1 dihydrofolate reductase [Kineococcus aurantiacus]